MKKALLLFVLFVSLKGFSQSINDYQYVIVPIKFDFLKENDKYHLNTMSKMLLQKYGFKSYLSNEEMPEEVINKRCGVLYASLVKDGNLFTTKVKLVLTDCKEKVVYETDFGTSREKDFATAYNQALREASKSFEKLQYHYNGKNDSTTTPTTPTTPKTPETPAQPETLSPNASNPDVFYFAQPIANGFQIVNSEPRVIMRLLNTSQKNVFIGLKGDKTGVVISKNGQWFFEYYENATLVSELLQLKF